MSSKKFGKVLSAAAKGVAKRGVNEACILYFYQPVISQSMKEKLRKDK
ncbi:cyclic lactone autoinducer peptide [[Clostridium] polysaccharolyticum]|uniref:Cyclic lactone autoinducer peptide n=1 Tax=[Clostridium] polysaccharolyticum TaxID=29364 RepID=A0A1I0BND1_9FIRM|nr:cyclic lactone autoinducer peptide [[Clostridium] polysaccharolyticum]SET08382.1 cyclic lactone autoinducer peptide [[Clostridium] polysaccharolyticum]